MSLGPFCFLLSSSLQSICASIVQMICKGFMGGCLGLLAAPSLKVTLKTQWNSAIDWPETCLASMIGPVRKANKTFLYCGRTSTCPYFVHTGVHQSGRLPWPDRDPSEIPWPCPMAPIERILDARWAGMLAQLLSSSSYQNIRRIMGHLWLARKPQERGQAA